MYRDPYSDTYRALCGRVPRRPVVDGDIVIIHKCHVLPFLHKLRVPPLPNGAYSYLSPTGESHRIKYTSYDKVLWTIGDWRGCAFNAKTGQCVTINPADGVQRNRMRVYCTRAAPIPCVEGARSHAQLFHWLLWHIACLATTK